MPMSSNKFTSSRKRQPGFKSVNHPSWPLIPKHYFAEVSGVCYLAEKMSVLKPVLSLNRRYGL
jgi:hypothetical protein